MQINLGVSTDQLIKLYDEVVKAVSDNLEIFKQVNNKVSSKNYISGFYTPDPETTSLISQLQDRLVILKDQKTQLEKNVQELITKFSLPESESRITQIGNNISNINKTITNG